MPISPIEDVIEDIKQGKMIILVDDEDRENEGDLYHGRRKSYPRGRQFHGQARPGAHLPLP